MLLGGIPAMVAAAYFLPSSTDPSEIRLAAQEFSRQPEVAEALQRLSGGVPWHKMEPEARLKLALEKTYAEMGFFLWSHNYADLSGPEKDKADRCRDVLERKLAGTAGQGNPLDKFYEEVLMQTRKQKIGKIGVA